VFKKIAVLFFGLTLAGCGGAAAPASNSSSAAPSTAAPASAAAAKPAASASTKPAASTAAAKPSASAAASANYPTRTVTIVVPNTAGNSVDLQTRVLLPDLTKALGQTVTVVNRPGATDIVGSTYVAKEAPADGYTIAAESDNSMATSPLTVKDMPFQPLKDLPPFIHLGSTRLELVAPANQPFKDFNEWVSYTKSNPGKLSYGASSSSNHLQIEGILRTAGLNVVYVPFSDTAANTAAILGAKTQITIEPEALALSQGDKIRILAQTGDTRSAKVPDVPTFKEAGFPQVQGFGQTFNLRSGTPQPIIDKLNATFGQVMQLPNVQAELQKLSLDVDKPMTPAEAIQAETDRANNYAKIAEQIGLKPA